MFIYKCKKISKNRVFLRNTESPQHFYIINKTDMSSSSNEIIEISKIIYKITVLEYKN